VKIKSVTIHKERVQTNRTKRNPLKNERQEAWVWKNPSLSLGCQMKPYTLLKGDMHFKCEHLFNTLNVILNVEVAVNAVTVA
jgi:hypothetical protein